MTKCKLKRNPKIRNKLGCAPEVCPRCGWEVSEAARREELLRKQGLTKGKDGLWRLKG